VSGEKIDTLLLHKWGRRLICSLPNSKEKVTGIKQEEEVKLFEFFPPFH
jgi:hypothetical protein